MASPLSRASQAPAHPSSPCLAAPPSQTPAPGRRGSWAQVQGTTSASLTQPLPRASCGDLLAPDGYSKLSAPRPSAPRAQCSQGPF